MSALVWWSLAVATLTLLSVSVSVGEACTSSHTLVRAKPLLPVLSAGDIFQRNRREFPACGSGPNLCYLPGRPDGATSVCPQQQPLLKSPAAPDPTATCAHYPIRAESDCNVFTLYDSSGSSRASYQPPTGSGCLQPFDSTRQQLSTDTDDGGQFSSIGGCTGPSGDVFSQPQLVANAITPFPIPNIAVCDSSNFGSLQSAGSYSFPSIPQQEASSVTSYAVSGLPGGIQSSQCTDFSAPTDYNPLTLSNPGSYPQVETVPAISPVTAYGFSSSAAVNNLNTNRDDGINIERNAQCQISSGSPVGCTGTYSSSSVSVSNGGGNAPCPYNSAIAPSVLTSASGPVSSVSCNGCQTTLQSPRSFPAGRTGTCSSGSDSFSCGGENAPLQYNSAIAPSVLTSGSDSGSCNRCQATCQSTKVSCPTCTSSSPSGSRSAFNHRSQGGTIYDISGGEDAPCPCKNNRYPEQRTCACGCGGNASTDENLKGRCFRDNGGGILSRIFRPRKTIFSGCLKLPFFRGSIEIGRHC